MTPQEIAQAYANGARFRDLMRTEGKAYHALKAILVEFGVPSRGKGGAHGNKMKEYPRHFCKERGRDCTLTPGAEECALCCANYMVELIVAGARMRGEEDHRW